MLSVPIRRRAGAARRRPRGSGRLRAAAVVVAALTALGAVQFGRPAEAATPADGLSSAPSQAFTVQGTNAFLSAQVAEIAYEDSPTVRGTELAKWGLREVRFHKPGGGTEILVAEKPGASFVFIGVRGTQGFRDMVTDANTSQRIPNWDNAITLHGGFLNAADAAWGPVLSEVGLSNMLGATVFLTGHSLGGAVAHILAYRLAGAGLPFHSVTTFGAPIAGTSNWAARYNSRLQSRTHDFVNKNDPVPCLPSNPLKRWDSVLDRHYHLTGTTAPVRDDAVPCGALDALIDELRIPKVEQAIATVTGVCDRVKKKRWRRFLKAVLPGICRSPASPVTSVVGLASSLIDVARLRGVGDHAMEEYIASMRGALSATGQLQFNVARPMELRDLGSGGSVLGVTQARTEPFGWTSVVSYNRSGRPYLAKVSDERGVLRVEEISTTGTVVRVVSDVQIPYGFNVIGTYESGANAYVVMLGAGHVIVRTIGTDGRIGAETSVTPVIDEVLPDTGTFAPTTGVVYDADGTGPLPPRVLAHDEENGQYRVRSLGGDGKVGTESARGTVTPGFNELTAYTTSSGQSVVLFLSQATGALEQRRVDKPTGNLQAAFQAVPGGWFIPGAYDAVPGWSGAAVFGGGDGFQLLIHNAATGATQVLSQDWGTGAIVGRKQSLTMPPGWNDLAVVEGPYPHKRLLAGVRR